MMDKDCPCHEKQAIVEPIGREYEEEHNSQLVDYSKVEATQRRRGLMLIE